NGSREGPLGGARCSTTQLSYPNPPLTHTTPPHPNKPHSHHHPPIKFSPTHTSNNTHASPALSYSPSTSPLPLQHSSTQPLSSRYVRANPQRPSINPSLETCASDFCWKKASLKSFPST